MRVEIYSDVVCPWCYIGKHRFERALADFPGAGQVEVVYRPYQLDPGAPTTAVPLAEWLERRYGPRAASMTGPATEAARAEGITLDFSKALAANTLAAHRLLRLAARENGPELQHALTERLFQAHFARGEDVGDPDTLARLAEEVGMDPERARAYLASDEGAEEVRAEIEEARRLGITAVPTFVFDGRWAVQGAQPAAAFREALETAAGE